MAREPSIAHSRRQTATTAECNTGRLQRMIGYKWSDRQGRPDANFASTPIFQDKHIAWHGKHSCISAIERSSVLFTTSYLYIQKLHHLLLSPASHQTSPPPNLIPCLPIRHIPIPPIHKLSIDAPQPPNLLPADARPRALHTP